jgi:hypothetical protein
MKRSKREKAPAAPVLEECDEPWDFSVAHGNRYVPVSQVRDRPQTLAKIAPRPLGEEVTRHWTVNNLRTELKKALGETVKSVALPSHLYEMWLFACNMDASFQILTSKLADFDMVEEKNMMQDVLIPQVELGVRELQKLLRESGASDEEIAAATEKVQPELKIAARAMHVAMMKDPSKRIEVEMRSEEDKLVVGKVMLPLTPKYRAKLRKLYERFASPSGECFEAVLATALLRYDALRGAVYQASVPPAVYDVLKKDFGVFLECFASPFNCYFPRYCSVFADDFAFGSLGSFFQFHPLDGSFVAFPPLVPAVVLATVRHIEDLLVVSQRALSFVVVVHGSMKDDSEPMASLLSSRFKCHRLVFAPREHALTEGLAYRKRSLLKLAVFPTSFVFLQNEAGKKRWPVDDGKSQRLKRAFAGKPIDDIAPAAAASPATPAAPAERVSSNWKSLQKQLKKAKK